MKTTYLPLLLTLLYLSLTSQNNFILFTESTEPFQIKYQGKLYPPQPQSDVKLTKITENPIRLSILFCNQKYPRIDTLLYLYYPTKPIQNMDVLYLLSKDNKTIRYLATLPSSDIRPLIPEIDTSIQVKTKEEKTIQKIIFLNDTNNLCLLAINTTDFNKTLHYIQKTPNQDRKIVLIEQFINHNCFNQLQAQALIEQIPFEVEKLKIMKQLIPKLTNVFGIEHFKEYLKYPLAQQSYIEYYQQYLNTLKNKPILNDSWLQIYLQKLQSIDNDQTLLNELKILLSHFSISSQPLETLLKNIKHDQNKEDALKCAYYSLLYKKDFEKLLELVEFKETKNRLKSFYAQQQN